MVVSGIKSFRWQSGHCGKYQIRLSIWPLTCWRMPCGPLAVLKKSWTDSHDVRADLGQPIEDYMTDLRNRLKHAADWAKLHAQHGQEVYVHHYNLRSQDKHLVEGDKVIVLDDNIAGKLCPRCVAMAGYYPSSQVAIQLPCQHGRRPSAPRAC